ncbi:MAG: hypothetical protein P4L22_06200 [Candidatus Babeliales bacterium]|nr:hypothetical protein [Candidatus Babeliales bacterium]
MINFLKYLTIISCFVTPLLAKQDTRPLIISIPKCGTHLLQKCIQLIIKDKELCSYAHARYSPDKISIINNRKSFFIIRDPRDQLISFIYHVIIRINVYKDNPEMREKLKSFWQYENLSFSEKISHLIDRGAPYYDIYRSSAEESQKSYLEWQQSLLKIKNHQNNPQIKYQLQSFMDYKNPTGNTTHGINQFYSEYLGWQKVPGICNIKFENLVGPKGGGTLEKQLAEIKKIAHHLGKHLSDKEIKEVAKNLFGESNTFRKGKIGSWKKHFNDDHKNHFKRLAGSLLINLGYEKDFNW